MNVKYKYLYLSWIAGSAILLSGCDNESVSIPDTDNTYTLELTRTETEVNSSLNDLSLEITKSVATATEPEKNIAISPLSIELALALLANSVDNESASDIVASFGFGDISTLNSACNKLIKYLSNPYGDSNFYIANSIWVNKDFNYSDSWESSIKSNYFAEAFSMDFSLSDNVTRMNDWCYDSTNGMITQIIDNINAYAPVYFINALFFSGEWESVFSEEDTNVETFTGTLGDKLVTMMHQCSDLGYAELDNAEIVRLPIKGDFEAYFILPAENISPNEMLTGISHNFWDIVEGRIFGYKVDISLPRFCAESSDDITYVLNQIGIPSSVNLSGMGIDNGLDIFAKHTSRIEIYEKGAISAAATIIEGDILNVGQGIKIEFNRPFAYIFRNKTSGTIISIGTVNTI